MSDLMQWLLILVVGYIFISVWIISNILDRILTALRLMNNELERLRRNQ
jgi:hypothetical protein